LRIFVCVAALTINGMHGYNLVSLGWTRRYGMPGWVKLSSRERAADDWAKVEEGLGRDARFGLGGPQVKGMCTHGIISNGMRTPN
jgi:hypothetical protein